MESFIVRLVPVIRELLPSDVSIEEEVIVALSTPFSNVMFPPTLDCDISTVPSFTTNDPPSFVLELLTALLSLIVVLSVDSIVTFPSRTEEDISAVFPPMVRELSFFPLFIFELVIVFVSEEISTVFPVMVEFSIVAVLPSDVPLIVTLSELIVLPSVMVALFESMFRLEDVIFELFMVTSLPLRSPFPFLTVLFSMRSFVTSSAVVRLPSIVLFWIVRSPFSPVMEVVIVESTILRVPFDLSVPPPLIVTPVKVTILPSSISPIACTLVFEFISNEVFLIVALSPLKERRDVVEDD